MTTLRDLAASRELLANLTLRELRGKYKRSALGWGWSLVNPLATMAIFTLVFNVVLKVEPPTSEGSGLRSYPLYFMCAFLPWAFIANGFTGSMTALLGNANLVKKVWFPREVLVGSTVLSYVATLLVELGVLAAAFLVMGNNVLPWLPGVLLLVVVQSALVLGIGLMFSVLNVYFRDVQHFVAIGLQLWFYATPIIYPLSKVLAYDLTTGFPVERVYRLNPMVGFVESYRALLYDLRWPDWSDLGYVTLFSLVVLVAGYLVFMRYEPRLAEEL